VQTSPISIPSVHCSNSWIRAIVILATALHRHNNLFGSFSYLTTTGYVLKAAEPAGPLLSVPANRVAELDANIGYYWVPGLATTMGYKQIAQDYGSKFKWSGPTIGLNASSAIGNKGLAIYGTVGYGFFKLKLPDDSRDSDNHNTRNATYTLTEFGIAYAMGPLVHNHKLLTLTLGYRSQFVTTKDYALAQTPVGQASSAGTTYTSATLRDTTRGFVFGLVASY